MRGADGRWWRHAKLTAPELQTGQWFGASVAIRNNTAVIGSPHWAHKCYVPGTAYVYERSGSNWTAAAQLLPPDTNTYGNLGHAVAIGSDYVVAGAPGVEAAYVFRQGLLQETLTASDGQTPDQFGYTVSASSMNTAVGAPQTAAGGFTYAGAAYLFRP